MSFYADAICTLEALARAVHGYDDRSACAIDITGPRPAITGKPPLTASVFYPTA